MEMEMEIGVKMENKVVGSIWDWDYTKLKVSFDGMRVNSSEEFDNIRSIQTIKRITLDWDSICYYEVQLTAKPENTRKIHFGYSIAGSRFLMSDEPVGEQVGSVGIADGHAGIFVNNDPNSTIPVTHDTSKFKEFDIIGIGIGIGLFNGEKKRIIYANMNGKELVRPTKLPDNFQHPTLKVRPTATIRHNNQGFETNFGQYDFRGPVVSEI